MRERLIRCKCKTISPDSSLDKVKKSCMSTASSSAFSEIFPVISRSLSSELLLLTAGLSSVSPFETCFPEICSAISLSSISLYPLRTVSGVLRSWEMFVRTCSMERRVRWYSICCR